MLPFLPTRIFRIKLLISKYFSEHNCSFWSCLALSVVPFRAARRFMQHSGHFPARSQPSLASRSAMSVPRWPGSGSRDGAEPFPFQKGSLLLFSRQTPGMPLFELLLPAPAVPSRGRGPGRGGGARTPGRGGESSARAPGRSGGTNAR